MMQEFGVNIGIRLRTDASAAKGIATRRGMGKVRHIEVNQLSVQEKVRNKEIELRKVSGTENLADALTKSVESEEILKHPWLQVGVGCTAGLSTLCV